MHRIGELQDHEAVSELGESLTKKGIPYHISQAMGGNHHKIYTVIIENPEDVEEATSVFNTLTGIPPSFEIPPEYEKIRSECFEQTSAKYEPKVSRSIAETRWQAGSVPFSASLNYGYCPYCWDDIEEQSQALIRRFK